MARSDDKTGIVTAGDGVPAGPAGTNLRQLERDLATAVDGEVSRAIAERALLPEVRAASPGAAAAAAATAAGTLLG